MRRLVTVAMLTTTLGLASCGAADPPAPSQARTSGSAPTTTTTAPARTDSSTTTRESESVEGAVVRFSARGQTVDVTLRADHPTSRDFLARLPMTIDLEEFAGREKISYLDPRLETEGSPGSDPEDGDLIYFAPWGNLGFYYDADSVGYSDDTIHLGTYDATRKQLERLEGPGVRVERQLRG